jgi:predicted Na+-dependent transporter
MLSLGAALSVSDLLAFWQQPALLARSLLAIIIIPPFVLVAILTVFNLPETFVLALMFMVASPGPALLTKRAATAGARLDYTLSLQITLALLAIIVTPLILKFFAVFYSGSELTVNAIQVAKQVGLVQFLPLGIGVAIATIWKDVAAEIVELISTIANTLFIIQALIILIISLDIVPQLGTTILIATALITLLGLAIGQVAGIGLAPDIQSGIAVATIARNAGLAIALAALNGQANVIPVIVGVLIVGIIVAAPYSAWMKGKVRSVITTSAASTSS